MNILKRFLLLFLLLCLVRCGMGDQSTSAAKCTGNYNAPEMSIYMQATTTTNQYEITICSINRAGTKTFSIFGAIAQSDLGIMSLSTHARAPHMDGATKPGVPFFVNFNIDDGWFAIYEDDIAGNFSRNNLLVSGQLPLY